MKSKNKFVRGLFGLILSCVVVLGITSCEPPKNSEVIPQSDKLVMPSIDKGEGTGQTYYIDGKFVSDAYWKCFVALNFNSENGIVYSGEWDRVCFKVDENMDLYFIYASSSVEKETIQNAKSNFETFADDSYKDSSRPTFGKIVGLDTTKSDGNNGFMLLLETSGHYNYPGSKCYAGDDNKENDVGDKKENDETRVDHKECFIPLYVTRYSNVGMIKESSYYKYPYACFAKKNAAIKALPYDSSIYSFASTLKK